MSPARMKVGRCYLLKGGIIARYHGPFSSKPDAHLSFLHPQYPVQALVLTSVSIAQDHVLFELDILHANILVTRITDAMARGMHTEALGASIALTEALVGAS